MVAARRLPRSENKKLPKQAMLQPACSSAAVPELQGHAMQFQRCEGNGSRIVGAFQQSVWDLGPLYTVGAGTPIRKVFAESRMQQSGPLHCMPVTKL